MSKTERDRDGRAIAWAIAAGMDPVAEQMFYRRYAITDADKRRFAEAQTLAAKRHEILFSLIFRRDPDDA